MIYLSCILFINFIIDLFIFKCIYLKVIDKQISKLF